MPAQIPLPLINGVRHSFASVEIKVANLIFVGVKGCDYSRKRSRAQVRGNHPDPIGQTRGENEYEASIEIYLAEFNQLQAALQALGGGKGYGDVFFDVICTYGENGFDTITDTIRGCSIDSTEASLAQGPDALTRTIDLTPLKILFNQIDDLAVPLVGVPG